MLASLGVLIHERPLQRVHNLVRQNSTQHPFVLPPSSLLVIHALLFLVQVKARTLNRSNVCIAALKTLRLLYFVWILWHRGDRWFGAALHRLP